MMYVKFLPCEENKFSFDYIAKVFAKDEEGIERETNHKVLHIYGGRNGCGRWDCYLMDFIYILNALKKIYKDSYIISIRNDCADDTFEAYIGVVDE